MFYSAGKMLINHVIFRKMFTAVGKVLGYFLGDDNTTHSDTESPVPAQESNEHESYPKTRHFDGNITHVFSSHGLIDNEVYFSFSELIGESEPSPGDRVAVVAVQEYKGGGWLASQVTLTSTWSDSDDEDDNECEDFTTKKPAEVVGRVIKYRDGKGYITDNIYLDLSQCDHGEYTPAVGDWVKTVVSYNDDDEIDKRVERIEPLRVSETEGVITAFQGDHGYIDGEVFFTPEACVDHYIPKKWDPVSYKAIESIQGRCTWRAISLQASLKPDTTR